MAISVEYGPISTALGLARMSGEGIRQQRQRQEELTFQQMVEQQRQARERAQANAISQALAQQNQAFQQQQATQEQQLREQQFEQAKQMGEKTLQLHQQQVANAEANAATRQTAAEQALELKKQEEARKALTFGNREQAIGNLPQEQQDLIRAQGHLPGGQAHDTARQLAAEYRRLTMAHRQAQKDLSAAQFDENDMKKLGTQESDTVPGAIKGMEAQYQEAQQTLGALQGRIQSLDSAINAQTQQTMTPQTQQSAPATLPQIVATATNPKTGQRIGFDANTGQWVSLGQ